MGARTDGGRSERRVRTSGISRGFTAGTSSWTSRASVRRPTGSYVPTVNARSTSRGIRKRTSHRSRQAASRRGGEPGARPFRSGRTGASGRVTSCRYTDARMAPPRRIATACLTTGLLLALGLPVAGLIASDAPSLTVKFIDQTQDRPVLDGVIDDAVWSDVVPYDTFTQQEPIEGAPATERTEVRLLLSRDTLYIGVICFDREPGQISCSRRAGAMRTSTTPTRSRSCSTRSTTTRTASCSARTRWASNTTGRSRARA